MRTLFNILSINQNNIKFYFYYLLLIIAILTLLGDFISLLASLNNYFIYYLNINVLDLLSHMTNNTSNSISTSTNTNTTIIHDDGSWSNGIRSIIIYGVGAFRLSLLRSGGTPAQRTFVVVSTIVGEATTKIINNTINDPNYLKNQYKSWTSDWTGDGEVKVKVDEETSTLITKAIENNNNSNKFISVGDSLGDLSQDLLNNIFDRLKFLLEPVQVNYSNELLSNQIYDLSIVLFILSLIIFGLIVALLLNLILYINMDRIIKYFNNKFIHWYLVMNKKFLGIEIFLLGSSILYFMYSLITGIRFIATHPITI